MQIVATDILGLFPKSPSDNLYVLVATEHFTRWAEAYPIPDQEAITVAKKLTNKMFLRFSPPDRSTVARGASLSLVYWLKCAKF